MLLSICIPTHHGRLGVLRGAIDSVLRQITDDLTGKVEVCVSDNASSDGTREAMERYCHRFPDQIVYHRNSENKGFAGNILGVVEMARGEYCWFLGSDDQIADGGVALVLDALERHPDVTGLTVNRRNYDAHLYGEVEQDPGFLLPDDPDQPHLYDKADEVFTNCSVMHTYMSAQIFKRRLWLEAVDQKGIAKFHYHSYYPHLYGIGAMVINHPKWMWLPDKIIKYRTGNDASLQHQSNRWHSHMIAVMDGLTKVWSELLGTKSSVYKAVMYKYFLFSWRSNTVRWVKSFHNYTSWNDLVSVYYYTKHLYFLPAFWFGTFPALLVPHFVIKVCRGNRLPLLLRGYHSLRYRTTKQLRKFGTKSRSLASASRE